MVPVLQAVERSLLTIFERRNASCVPRKTAAVWLAVLDERASRTSGTLEDCVKKKADGIESKE
jgi:hypothetical protein